MRCTARDSAGGCNQGGNFRRLGGAGGARCLSACPILVRCGPDSDVLSETAWLHDDTETRTMPEDINVSDKIDSLRQLGIWTKIAEGDIHLVTQKDTLELFRVLDDGRKGTINATDLMTLQAVDTVKLNESDLKALVHDADRDGNGHCTAEDLYHALTQGVLAFNLVKEGLRKKEVELKSHQIEREKLLEWMKFEYETSTALWSLPMTIGSFIAFSWVAATHIDLFHSWRVHNALLERFPTLTVTPKRKYVDIPTLNTWTRDHYLPTVFRQDDIYDPVPGRLAEQNQMITGVRFAKGFYEPSPCPTGDEVLGRIFDSRNSECINTGDLQWDYIVFPYQLEKRLLLEQFDTLVSIPWLDDRVRILEYQVFLYNANVNLFTLEIIQFEFEPSGLMKPRQHYESFSAEPYLAVTNLIPDIFFIMITLRVVYTNIKEMIPAIMAGLDGFINYWSFWKVLEWISLIFGGVCFGMWVTVFFKITIDLPAALDTLPKGQFDRQVQLKGALEEKKLAYLTFQELEAIMSLDEIEEKLNVIMTIGNSIRDDSELMRNMFALNFMVVVFRFFKSFQANPWLDIVVQTLVHCTPNVAHFFLVFSAIFTCYAFAGHFLLGNVLKGYSNAQSALFSRYRSSVGAAELQELPIAQQVLGYTWVLSYQLLVGSLILSMLIGIVFGSYYAVQSATRKPMTLWTQVRKAFQTAAETRSYLSLWSLIVLMEDDDYPAHPNKIATSQSLKKAFEKEKMSRQNAEYLIRKSVEFLKDHTDNPELDLPDAVKIIGNSHNLCQKHEEFLQQSHSMLCDNLGKSPGEEGMPEPVGLVQPPQEPSAEVTATEEQLPADLLLKGLENLISMFNDMKNSQDGSREKLLHCLAQERQQAAMRRHRLQGIVEEFRSRVQRAQRGVVRLVHFMGTADFGSIAHVPDQIENDVMRCFAERGVEAGAGMPADSGDVC
eukprot:s2546_g2.t7